MIEVHDLTKRYGTLEALRGITFQVSRGQVVGFLGPNGAGKTTTMKILTGFLAPTSGTATVAGYDVTSDPLPALRRIGYLPAGNPQYNDLRVVETLRFAAELHGMRGAERDAAVDASISAVGLEDRRLQQTGTLSTGFRQRVGLARALLHKPDVLILDEPTSGLDPNQQQEMRTLIRELGREKTVILSTHILSEVEAVCDRAIIIDEGKIVADDSVAAIRSGKSAVVLEVRATPDAARRAFEGMFGVESVDAVPVDGAPEYSRVRIGSAADRATCEALAARAASAGLPLASLSAAAASLEQVFAELTAGTPEEAPVRETLAVMRKELRSFFVGPIPYLVAMVFVVGVTWLVFDQSIFLVLRQANLDALFSILPIAFVFVVPAVSMRSWAEEIRGETLETLMTAPVRVRHLVLGKFLSALAVVGLCLVGTAGVPITAATLGRLDGGPLVAGYLGALLVGGTNLAIGQYVSARTNNQIVAFLITLVVCFVLCFADVLFQGGESGALLASISTRARFQSLSRGVFDLRDMGYYLSLIGFSLYLTVESIENRRHV